MNIFLIIKWTIFGLYRPTNVCHLFYNISFPFIYDNICDNIFFNIQVPKCMLIGLILQDHNICGQEQYLLSIATYNKNRKIGGSVVSTPTFLFIVFVGESSLIVFIMTLSLLPHLIFTGETDYTRLHIMMIWSIFICMYWISWLRASSL